MSKDQQASDSTAGLATLPKGVGNPRREGHQDRLIGKMEAEGLEAELKTKVADAV
jgi:hypothetical protein